MSDPRTDGPRDHEQPPPEAGPRPGVHPEVERSGTSRSTAWVLAGLLVLAGLIYAANWFGMIGGG